jgi:hypothetical protein
MANETTHRIGTKAIQSDFQLLVESPLNSSILSFRFSLWLAAILIASGFMHLAILAWNGADWDGPLSLRKPALFGISGGLTVWSLAWLMTQLRPQRFDRVLVSLTSMSLFIEVGLITLQYWRGVSSHFNHATVLDASIEALMLALILFHHPYVFTAVDCQIASHRDSGRNVASLAIMCPGLDDDHSRRNQYPKRSFL